MQPTSSASDTPQSNLTNPPRRWTESTALKMIVLGFLILLLLIPVAQISSLVRERSYRQMEVRSEIANLWGHQQTLTGPVLRIPFRVAAKEDEKAKTLFAYFLPKEIRWQGSVAPEIRYRGIFEAVVYETTLTAEGIFERPHLGWWDSSDVEVLWSQATVSVGLSDVRGLRERSILRWGDQEIPFEPGARAEALSSGIHVPLGADGSTLAENASLAFGFDLALRGSERLALVPVGESTEASLTSSWNDPAFVGSFLPSTREVEESGFSANWQVPYFGRNFPQQWVGSSVAESALQNSAFGVELVLPADAYQQTTRSVKYAVLFILLTFVTFFLIEIVSPVRLHAAQYLLIGFALCLFYVLLLAGSEHIGFGKAYGVATAAIVALVAGYSRSILESSRWAAILALCMGSLYGYLYVLLQLEEFALLLGAIGLFAILSLVMFLTRNLDWRTLRFDKQDRAVMA